MEECHYFIVLEKTGLLRARLAQVANERGRRVASRAIGGCETWLHVEVCRVAESICLSATIFHDGEAGTP